MADAHKNFGYTTVTSVPTPATSGTTLIVTDGTVFPATPFNATIWPIGVQPSASNAEIVRVTNIATNTLTITRIQESTVARAILVGDQIADTITAKTLTDVETGGIGIASQVANDLIYAATATQLARLANGTTGQILVATTAAAPSWGSVPNQFTYVAKTAIYTAVANDFVDCTANTFAVTLPASSSNANKGIIVVNSGAGVITISRTGADVIGNQAETSQTLNPGDSFSFMSSGTGLWRII